MYYVHYNKRLARSRARHKSPRPTCFQCREAEAEAEAARETAAGNTAIEIAIAIDAIGTEVETAIEIGARGAGIGVMIGVSARKNPRGTWILQARQWHHQATGPLLLLPPLPPILFRR